MKICVVGMGYIGLPTALMLAANGQKVTGVDYKESVVTSLREGKVTFKEAGLPELFAQARSKGIRFQQEYPVADCYIIAVPTPYEVESKKIDAAYVVAACEKILEVCQDNAILAIESTVSPGTIDKDIRPIVERSGKKVHLVHVPERILPGNMIYELQHNSRTIGCDDDAVGAMVQVIYSSFCKGEIVRTDIRTAEMSKVVENTFRDINIAYANELTKICRKTGMDVYEVIRIANKHPRVNILQPGPGVGGHCISVDPWFLVGDFPKEAQLIRKAREVNSNMPKFVLGRIDGIMEEEGFKDFGRVGFYGLTYKENVDDVRESPTLQLLDVIKSEGRKSPAVYDPMVSADLVPHQYHDFEKFLAEIDMVVLLVGHTHIREHLAELSDKVLLDTRNVCENTYKL